MSTPLPPRASNATRQLLEELDVLMQRMLALPVNELGPDLEGQAGLNEEPPVSTLEAPPREEAVEQPSSLPSASALQGPEHRMVVSHPSSPLLPVPHLPRQTPAAQPQPQPAAVLNDLPPPIAWHPALQLPPERKEVAAPSGAKPQRQDIPAPPGPKPHKVFLPPVQRASSIHDPVPPPPLGWLTRLLLWSNGLFDNCTGWLGPLGRWLQGYAGRALLGWTGIGLLLGAACWGIANWLDWTW